MDQIVTTADPKFGSYDWICSQAQLVVCPLIGEFGISPTCFARNVQLGSTIIFQPATGFMHICAMIMVIVMVIHVRGKYTAVGRKEIVNFFYLYFLVCLFSFFLDTGIIPIGSEAYLWITAIQVGLVVATYWCLLVNGFVGFQLAEDGTRLSVWSLRISSMVIFLVGGLIAAATFKNAVGFSTRSPLPLFIVHLIFPAAAVLIYICLQLFLVFKTLQDRWPIGDIIFGTAFYGIGLGLLFGFSVKICTAVTHYIDGLFFATLCVLLAVMMVYKYWDSITKEDLEFSVGSRQGVWKVEDLDDNHSSYPPSKQI